jgi:hypothetical protein
MHAINVYLGAPATAGFCICAAVFLLPAIRRSKVHNNREIDKYEVIRASITSARRAIITHLSVIANSGGILNQ